jgi:hypothetical protein
VAHTISKRDGRLKKNGAPIFRMTRFEKPYRIDAKRITNRIYRDPKDGSARRNAKNGGNA